MIAESPPIEDAHKDELEAAHHDVESMHAAVGEWIRATHLDSTVLAWNLRAITEGLHLSYSLLETLTGLNRSGIWHIVKGKSAPRSSTLAQISLTLRVPPILWTADETACRSYVDLMRTSAQYGHFFGRLLAEDDPKLAGAEKMQLAAESEEDGGVEWSDALREATHFFIRATTTLHRGKPSLLLPGLWGACIGRQWGSLETALATGLIALHLHRTCGPGNVGNPPHALPSPILIRHTAQFLDGHV